MFHASLFSGRQRFVGRWIDDRGAAPIYLGANPLQRLLGDTRLSRVLSQKFLSYSKVECFG